MADYRLYENTPEGNLVSPAEVFFATSDEVAINFAASRAGQHGAELWSHDRFVAAIVPRRGEAAS